MAFAKSASNLSNNGSPNPTGVLRTKHLITPPIVSPSFRAARIDFSINFAASWSGQRTGLLSISAEVTVSKLVLDLISATLSTQDKISIPCCFNSFNAIAPAATFAAVVLAELLPPPDGSLTLYFCW